MCAICNKVIATFKYILVTFRAQHDCIFAVVLIYYTVKLKHRCYMLHFWWIIGCWGLHCTKKYFSALCILEHNLIKIDSNKVIACETFPTWNSKVHTIWHSAKLSLFHSPPFNYDQLMDLAPRKSADNKKIFLIFWQHCQTFTCNRV